MLFANSNMKSDDFEAAFQRLLTGEKFDFYGNDGGVNLSRMFEIIATNLMAETPERQFMWYDGVVNFSASIRKSRQVEFKGEMWVGDDGKRQWKEDFRARVTDKISTKQGIWITLWIGESKAEGELLVAFGQA